MSDSHGKKFRGNRNQFRGGREDKHECTNGELEILKAEAKDIINKFLKSGSLHTTLDAMSREKRKMMHAVAQSNGLVTRSTGKEPDRYIILSHRENKLTRSSFVTTNPISPSEECLSKLSQFVADNPITEIEMKEFLTEKNSKKPLPKKGFTRNQGGVPPVPCCSKEIQKTKDSLPASKYRQQVLDAIDKNDVVIISGGTGCGKTTQVPQFILEQATEKNKNVRIMVTQPRRIAAISISERVAKERGEPLGDTVGYQIRLESRSSQKTLLTYCTTGVLLRMLTSDPVASGITHIIMDEIHEREINTDYLLIALRECIKKRKDLKIILMSATIEGNMQLFSKYFQNHSIEIIRIEARTFDVKIFYIDQILAMSGYQPPESQVFFSAVDFKPEDWIEELKAIREKENGAWKNKSDPSQNIIDFAKTEHAFNASTVPPDISSSGSQRINPNPRSTVPQLDGALQSNTSANEWSSGLYHTPDGEVIEERTMIQFMTSVGCSELRPALTTVVSQNQRKDQALMPKQHLVKHPYGFKSFLPMEISKSHSKMDSKLNPPSFIPPPAAAGEKASTPSTASSGLAKFSTEEFGGFGVTQRFAGLLEQQFRLELKSVIPDRTVFYDPKMDNLVQNVDFAKLRFTEKYDMFYGLDYDNSIDHNLLDHVIKYLTDSPVFGTILVFLPGFDDIQLTLGKIEKWKNRLTNMKHVLVIPLHSQMQTSNHKDIFKPVDRDTRKIILATNIAEASITIEDVMFVVDTGKVKEKWYDHEAKLSTLAVKSIARSNAEQRSGRAGRVAKGYCIRLYSEKTFDAMPETQVAEMKRAAIYDVTLHAKLFAPNNMKISDFLSLAPEPPEQKSISQSMDFLEQLGAFYRPNHNLNGSFNESENDGSNEQVDPELTNMGRLMARLPLDPQLSRMLLFGLSLKCLAPIVNLVALLASREPYVLAQSDEREKQSKMKFEMAEQDFSDHLMYIRLCTAFCSKVSAKEQNDFCRDHLLNPSTMRMVHGTRRQLLKELLRAKVVDVPEKDVMVLLSDPEYNAHSNSWTMVQAAIAAGCYPSIGVSSAESHLKKVQTFNDRSAALHPSSILKKQIGKLSKKIFEGPRLEYVVFQEMCRMSSDRSLSMKTVTAIPALTALLFTGPIRLSQQIVDEHGIISKENEDDTIQEQPSSFGVNVSTLNLDDWYSVKADTKTMRHCLRLRHKMMQFFLNGIAKPKSFGPGTTNAQKKMLDIIRQLLDEAHLSHNFARVDMPISTGRACSSNPRHNEVFKNEAVNRKGKFCSDSHFSYSRGVNNQGQWNRKTHSHSSRPAPEVPNTSVLKNVSLPSGTCKNMNEISRSSNIHSHIFKPNPNFNRYNSESEWRAYQVDPIGSIEQPHHLFSQLTQIPTTSMGGSAPRGARGGNSSRVSQYNARGGKNNSSNNQRTN